MVLLAVKMLKMMLYLVIQTSAVEVFLPQNSVNDVSSATLTAKKIMRTFFPLVSTYIRIKKCFLAMNLHISVYVIS